MRKNFIDFGIYQTAAEKILHRQAQFLYERDRVAAGGNYYSYFWGLLFVPIAVIGSLFGTVCGKFSFLLLFYFSYLKLLRFSVLQVLGAKYENSKKYYLLAIICMVPTAYLLNDAFMNSNIGLLLTVLLIFAFEFRERFPLVSAALVAAAAVIKVYPVLILGYFIWERRSKVVLWSLVFGAFFYVGIPILIEGWALGTQLLADHMYVVRHYDKQSGWGYENFVFQNIPGTLMRYARLMGLSMDSAYRLAIYGGLGMMFVVHVPTALKNTRRLSEALRQRYFFLSMAFIPLITPVSWYNMALFYMPVIAWVGRRSFFDQHRRSQILFALFFALYCLTTRDLVGRENNHILQIYSVQFFGLCLLVGSFAMDLYTDSRAELSPLQE